MFKKFSSFLSRIKGNSIETLLWIVDFFPTMVGCSYFKKEINVVFWLVNGFFSLVSIYVYLVGSIAYYYYYAKEVIDFANIFFYISIFLVTMNIFYWMVSKRSEVEEALDFVKKNDDLVRETGRFIKEQRSFARNMKRIVFICYLIHLINDIFLYVLDKLIKMDDITVSSCIGLNPLSGYPNLQICMAVIFVQVLLGVILVLGYDVLFIFFTVHTTTMYQCLYKDVVNLEKISEDPSVLEHKITILLWNLIKRHTVILDTVQKLQSIYSFVLIVDFGNTAVALCLFFALPFDVSINFGPYIFYGLIIFFLYCFLGEKLTFASELYEKALYCCDWENFSLKNKRMILVMMMLSQKPVALKAAGIIPLRIYSFANIMRTIYKFVTAFKM
ncbi:odorant receptor 10a-like [Achroia grisella]|uniref:odorant receptor 10a-like n=1 Tax=Achroia grisella TaxID=688607 RepID=UPI0027D2B239|nr:odorant receptor 10a-like [Achroia grisella]